MEGEHNGSQMLHKGDSFNYTISMKIKTFLSALTTCLAIVFLSGCGKTEPQPPAVGEAQKNTGTMAEQAKPAVTNAVQETKQAAQTAATNVQQAAAKATETAAGTAPVMEAQAQSLIDKAKSLVTDKKYQDALTTLNSLKNIKLTEEQQKLVDDLKTQIQKLMTTDATKTVGDILPK
jgi:hypothetical protein